MSALLSLKDIDFTWISTAQSDIEKEIGLEGFKAGNILVKFIDIPSHEYNSFYNIISNRILWYTQHRLWDQVYNPSFDFEFFSDWQRYRKVNNRFARAVADCSYGEKPPFVMVQDYHLYMVPYFLKKICPGLATNIFIHIPWPDASSWQVLPDFVVKSIVLGLLESDIVAFHCEQYADNFFSTARQYTGLIGDSKNGHFYKDGHKTKILHMPISIDIEDLEKSKRQLDFKSYVKEISDLSEDKIIVRVDRADLSKNIFRGFLAYEKLLENRKDLIGKVTFNAMLYPTRTAVPEYKRYLKKIKQKVASINKKFGHAGWKPVHIRIADNYLESLAALSLYDVLLVNPVADGMNLVAKEGPVINTRNGTVVLSKHCGAHNELGGFCLSVNPFDVNQTAEALEQALSLSEKTRRERAMYLKSIVKNNNSRKWLYYNILAMEAIGNEKAPRVVCRR